MTTYLDAIVAFHRNRASQDGRSRADLERAAAVGPAPRSFRRAIEFASSAGDIAVIAEVKRRSPSKGDLAIGLEVKKLAQAYADGGATGISVLTDEPHFGGSARDLEDVRAQVVLPILRKDFTVSINDVLDARCMGADAVLLIAAILNDGELHELASVADAIGLDTLIEVHDETELERVVRVHPTMIGVNQRDLHTFEIDAERALRVREAMPKEVTSIAESGIRSSADVKELAKAGFDAILIGEALIVAANPMEALLALRGKRLSMQNRH